MNHKYLFYFVVIIYSVLSCHCDGKVEQPGSKGDFPLITSEIRIRDPFIYPNPDNKLYYMYAQTGNHLKNPRLGQGVEAYLSPNLRNWSEPQLVFTKPDSFWGGHEIWAPEMHKIGKYYYLFVTFNGRVGGRGTQILRAKDPAGPFLIFRSTACSPADERCLDGTPWIDAKGQNWMVYCHEWVQIKDGAVKTVKMSADFSRRISEPVLLFNASDAPWTIAYGDPKENYVTDGPFFHKTAGDELLMLWSSIAKDGYAVGLAVSERGNIEGPWLHQTEPIFAKDGGHSMLFKTFDGQLLMALHQPNEGKAERLKLFKAEVSGETFLIEPWKDEI